MKVKIFVCFSFVTLFCFNNKLFATGDCLINLIGCTSVEDAKKDKVPDCADGSSCTVDIYVPTTNSCRYKCNATDYQDPCCENQYCVNEEICAQPLLEETSDTYIIDENYNCTATITDIHNFTYTFERLSLNRSIADPDEDNSAIINKMLITVEKSEDVFDLIWLVTINEIIRINSDIIEVSLRDGRLITGNWVTNNETRKYYGLLIAGYIYGLVNIEGVNLPKKIQIDNVKHVDFDCTNALDAFNAEYEETFGQEDQYYPKIIETIDGEMYDTDLGYILDFCGHFHNTDWHIRCTNSAQGYQLTEVNEIELTGEFSEDHPSYREVIFRLNTGEEELIYLYMTSESYYGSHRTTAVGRHLDSIFGIQDYGAVFIRLDKIFKIYPNYQ